MHTQPTTPIEAICILTSKDAIENTVRLPIEVGNIPLTIFRGHDSIWPKPHPYAVPFGYEL